MSTTEVARAIFESSPMIADTVVYGVVIEGYDGKAGMATVVLKESASKVDFEALAKAYSRLPSFSRPIFIRITAKIPLTNTFKHKKIELVKDGYDIEQLTDSVYMYIHGSNSFEVLTSELLMSIRTFVIKL